MADDPYRRMNDYLTARAGPVCAGCLSDDERRAQSIATLDEMAASNENVTGR